MSTALIICAAGQGKRMGTGKNKQFLLLDNKPLLVHTLEKCSASKQIDYLLIVAKEEEIPIVEEMLATYAVGHKVCQVVAGGRERQDSVYQGLMALKELAPDWVLIHDGARPFVEPREIEQCLTAAKETGAAVLAVPVTDTIKQSTKQQTVETTLDRSLLWAVQTPQAFAYPLILQAHERAKEEGFLGTDDASLVERLKEDVALVQGTYRNIKLTTQEDILLAEYLLKGE